MESKIIEKNEFLEHIRGWKIRAHDEYKTELIGLFGSWARGEARHDSDIDILVEFLPGASLFDWVGLAQIMEEDLNHKVDLVPEKNLKQRLRSNIEAELIKL
jgi:hypothetical protein